MEEPHGTSKWQQFLINLCGVGEVSLIPLKL